MFISFRWIMLSLFSGLQKAFGLHTLLLELQLFCVMQTSPELSDPTVPTPPTGFTDQNANQASSACPGFLC